MEKSALFISLLDSRPLCGILLAKEIRMIKYVIVAPNGTHYMPFQGCRLLELPEYQDEHFDMDNFVKENVSELGMTITAEFDDGEVIQS